MEIYPPTNNVCQDAVFLFKDRPELIHWVYGEAWKTSSVKVLVLSSFGVWQIDFVRLGRLLRTLCGQYKILRGSSSRRELNLGLG